MIVTMLLLHYLKHWGPFHIDALGIVTLLGADEVNNHVGKLVRNSFLEYLPLLGSYIIANDAFVQKQPGFQLYNFDAFIYTPDISGWFTRWLMAQDLRTASSCVEWDINPQPLSTTVSIWVALILGILLNGGFMVLTVMMGVSGGSSFRLFPWYIFLYPTGVHMILTIRQDWWGLANAISMAVSTATRAYLVSRNRKWLDEAVLRCTVRAVNNNDPKAFEGIDSNKPPPSTVFKASDILELRKVKTVVVLSDARAIVVLMPECLVVDCFVYTPKPLDSTDETKQGKTFPPRMRSNNLASKIDDSFTLFQYRIVRWIAWVAFGAHVITIGMSDLVSQLVTVVLIVLPTFFYVNRVGCNDRNVGTRLKATITQFPPENTPDRRSDMYAFLNLDSKQQDALTEWSLAPLSSNEKWWNEYKKKKELYNRAVDGKPEPLLEMKTDQERIDAMNARRIIPTTSADPAPAVNVTARHTKHDTA